MSGFRSRVEFADSIRCYWNPMTGPVAADEASTKAALLKLARKLGTGQAA